MTGVTSFQQSLYEFFDSGLLFRIALLQKTILFFSQQKRLHFCIDWHAVYRVNMTDYAHHADSSNVLHGMQALIAISDGADSLDCAAMAIGQSRHLGGGLLVPVDLYLSSLHPDEDFGKGVPTWLK